MGEPNSGQYSKLPPGWDCKFDHATGNCYYINYFTKAMQLEDPRIRYKQLQNERCSSESIPMQGPSKNQSLNNMSSSPLLSSKNHLEMSPIPYLKTSAPQTPRLPNMSRRSTIQETSFSNQNNTDAVVTKIQNMFPTASENHIRLLLHRYMKTIFPKADEMLLLDVLASSDNNVQIASEKLIGMGYAKRDFVAPKVNDAKTAEATKAAEAERIMSMRPKEQSEQEKAEMKQRLQEKYKNIEERILLMALESVNYSEDRAIQILQIVEQEDETRAKKDNELAASKTKPHATDKQAKDLGVDAAVTADKSSRKDAHTTDAKQKYRENENEQEQHKEFESLIGRIAVMGHNVELARGADDNLLLADYVTWNGANPQNLLSSRKSTVTGPDPTLLGERNCSAVGRNRELCKGAKAGLAKGSIYAKLAGHSAVVKGANIRCN